LADHASAAAAAALLSSVKASGSEPNKQVIGHWFLQCMFRGASVSVHSGMLIYSDVTVDSHHSHVWEEENPLTTVNQSYQCVV